MPEPWNDDALLEEMRTAPCDIVLSPVRSVTGEFHARVTLPSGRVLIGKPAFPLASAHMHMSLDEAEQSVRNEAAAYVVARQLGVTDLVPITVVRTLTWPKLGVVQASLQVPWPPPNDMRLPLKKVDQHDVLRAAAFDTLIRNTDRAKTRNWDVAPGDPARLRLFDHALSFGVSTRAFNGQNSFFYGERCGFPLTATVRDGLKQVVDAAGEGLDLLVAEDEVTKMLHRAERMLEADEIAA